jgi:hypothetical protein
MKRLFLVAALFAVGCGTNEEGARCNPLRATSDCNEGLSCVYPITPGCNVAQPGSNCCGVSFCCTMDANGNITSTNPSCQPDPASASVCNFDMSVGAPDDLSGPLDSGSHG